MDGIIASVLILLLVATVFVIFNLYAMLYKMNKAMQNNAKEILKIIKKTQNIGWKFFPDQLPEQSGEYVIKSKRDGQMHITKWNEIHVVESSHNWCRMGVERFIFLRSR